MDVRKYAITNDQRDRILVLEEGHFADLKGLGIKPAKLTQTASAFANASGGGLDIGIDEVGSLIWRQRTAICRYSSSCTPSVSTTVTHSWKTPKPMGSYSR